MTDIPETPIQLLLVDDHQIVIDGIKSLLRKDPSIQVVAEALSGKEAIQSLQTESIDLMITDINMPGMSGLELTSLVKKEFPEVKVLVLSMHHDYEIVNEIILTDAEGFILKNTGKRELIDAIYKVAQGSTFYSREVLSIMMERVAKKKAPIDEKASLTPRELEILALIAQEYSSAEIAESLHISPRTVDTHRKHIMKKTASRTIVGLIRFAISNGLVEL